jgi:hypothetical protein
MGGTVVLRAVVNIKLGDCLRTNYKLVSIVIHLLFLVLYKLFSMLKTKLLLKSSFFWDIMPCRLLKASVLEEHNCFCLQG